MKEVKYIPGDLVMTDGVPIGTKKGVVYIVTASDPNRTITLERGEVLIGTVTLNNVEGMKFTDKGFLFCDCAAWVKNIVPIPLTPQILEANGWKKYIEDSRTFCRKKEYRLAVCHFNTSPNPTEYRAYYEDKCTSLRIFHVHQLQHLLFGLGLDSSLKV